METLKYRVIKTRDQYDQYCNMLKSLLQREDPSEEDENEIDLLTLLIEKYDEFHNQFEGVDPVILLRSLMRDHQLTATALAGLLGITKSYMSEILNYKKHFSKEVTRKLALHFKVRQEVFNIPYRLDPNINNDLMNAG